MYSRFTQKYLLQVAVCFAIFFRLTTRFGQQAELKEQNQQLLASNEELHKSLANTQVPRARFYLGAFVDIEFQSDATAW